MMEILYKGGVVNNYLIIKSWRTGEPSTFVHVEGEVRYRQGVITDYFFLEALLRVSLRTTPFSLSAPTEPEPRTTEN